MSWFVNDKPHSTPFLIDCTSSRRCFNDDNVSFQKKQSIKFLLEKKDFDLPRWITWPFRINLNNCFFSNEPSVTRQPATGIFLLRSVISKVCKISAEPVWISSSVDGIRLVNSSLISFNRW